MNAQILELEVINADLNLEIKVTEDETILEIRETIMNLYNYKNIRNFELFLDGFHLNEFYDQYLIRFFFNKLELKKLHVLKTSQTQLYEAKTKDQIESLFKLNDELYLQYECEQGFRHSLDDMRLLEGNLQSYLKELEDKLKVEEVFIFPKAGNSDNNIFDQIYKFENLMKSKQNVLEAKMHQLFLCRKKEQKAIKLGKLNKEAVTELSLLETTLNVMKEKMVNLKDKEYNVRKQKRKEANYINNYITNKKKVTSLALKLESIKLRFSKLYKYSVLLKLINEKTVLAFHTQYDFDENKEGKLEIRNIIDECSFGEKYYQQNKRDEFFLNLKEKLFIAVKNNVYLYEYKSNKVFELPDMKEDHKGGSFVYVPGTNSVYCISGLISILTEELSLEHLDVFLKKRESPKIAEWKVTTKLKSPRSYYSVCVIDSFIIYILLGFDLLKGEFLSNFERYDTSKPDETWVNFKILSEKPVKLTFSGVIVTSDEEVYILGGKDEHNNDNTFIYVLDLMERTAEDSEMRLPIPPGIEAYNIENKNLFYQETCFLPLMTNSKSSNINNMFFLCCYDSKNFLHRVNIKTFDYSFIHQELEGVHDIEESESISQLSNNNDADIEKLNNK